MTVAGDIERAATVIHAASAMRPEVALVLGSGLGQLADALDESVSIPYADIPEFPISTAPGHAGRLVVGLLNGRPVAAMAGRAHMYEGYSAQQVVFPLRVLARLGARCLVVTNAAGGVNPQFHPGTLMLIGDHINLTGRNPLVGPNEPSLGVRFPDMTEAYDPELRGLARGVAARLGIAAAEGVYLGLLGPSYETPAEIRMARTLGADAVGMSTVMEVIAANHMGMRVAGISCITNLAAGMLPQKLTEEEVIETAAAVRQQFGALVQGVVSALPGG
jgi:purine-nucleoside phosphorylase